MFEDSVMPTPTFLKNFLAEKMMLPVLATHLQNEVDDRMLDAWDTRDASSLRVDISSSKSSESSECGRVLSMPQSYIELQ